jgi:hypothetical protein
MARRAITPAPSKCASFLDKLLALERNYAAFITTLWHSMNDSGQIWITRVIANNGNHA